MTDFISLRVHEISENVYYSVERSRRKHDSGTLLVICSGGHAEDLQSLLSEASSSKVALSSRQVPHNSTTVNRPVAQDMLSASCRAGQADNVSCVLHFAQDRDVVLASIIHRNTVVAAIEGPSALSVFTALVESFPAVVNLDLGLIGDPLKYALSKDRPDLVEYLLDHGADPNARICEQSAHGYHLRHAAARGSLRGVDALLNAGAKIQGSGAMLAAAESGRIYVLGRLLESGGDVNETLDINDGFLGRRTGPRTKQRAEETPLQAAVGKDHDETATWLRVHGAL